MIGIIVGPDFKNLFNCGKLLLGFNYQITLVMAMGNAKGMVKRLKIKTIRNQLIILYDLKVQRLGKGSISSQNILNRVDPIIG